MTAKIMLERKRKWHERPRACPLCQTKTDVLDYKDVARLQVFVRNGKIVQRKSSGNCARHQRMVARAVKRAREMALISYGIDSGR